MKKIGKKLFLRNGKFLGTIVLDYFDLSQKDQCKYLTLGDIKGSSLVALEYEAYKGWKLSSFDQLIINLIKKYYFKKIDFEKQRFWVYTNFEISSLKIKNDNLLNNE